VTTVQKFLAGLTAIGLVTALTLPGRQTPAVIKAGGDALSKVFGTVIAK
jgi:hypothetical protein